MLKPILLGLTLAVLAASSGYGVSSTENDRPDCPGQITCPLDGQPVCRDRCPVTAPQTDQPTEPRPCCAVTF